MVDFALKLQVQSLSNLPPFPQEVCCSQKVTQDNIY